jgi:hypothetical protein
MGSRRNLLFVLIGLAVLWVLSCSFPVVKFTITVMGITAPIEGRLSLFYDEINNCIAFTVRVLWLSAFVLVLPFTVTGRATFWLLIPLSLIAGWMVCGAVLICEWNNLTLGFYFVLAYVCSCTIVGVAYGGRSMRFLRIISR